MDLLVDAVALMLCLNRQLITASTRVQMGNYALSGLVGFDMHGKTVGVVGTGKIGRCTIDILLGMGCEVITHDLYPNAGLVERGIEYVALEDLLPRSDIVTLHCPLTPKSYHLMNAIKLAMMREGAMLINTSRGALVDTAALEAALASRRVGSCGLDVYEHEEGVFFEDISSDTDDNPGASLSEQWDTQLANLAARPNVIVTPHQAFLTQEALTNIAHTTADNLREFAGGVARYTNGVVHHAEAEGGGN